MNHSLAATALALLLAAGTTACGKKDVSDSAEPAAPAIAPFAASESVKPFAIGEFQAAALSDGGISFPNDGKTLAINKTKADVDALLTANNLATDQLHLSLQPLAVRTADEVWLFDTGAGSLFGPTVGKLGASLAAAGIHPASVTDIFISHGHGDHIGGLVADDALVFANAAIHIQAAEWDSLRSQEQMASIVALIEPKVTAFQPDADLVPGVKAVDIRGHTPGHSGYLIASGDQSVLYIGDTMHHSVISVQEPDWTIAFDGDATTAQASRKRIIESAAGSDQRIYAVHFPFPGLGKFAKQGERYVWVAE